METLTREHFTPHVGEGFRIRLDPEHVLEIELVDVKTLGSVMAGSELQARGRDAFSLYFRGPLQPILLQQIWRVEHATVGDRDIFLVAIGPDRGGMIYEAIFT
jgi:hypothetical protein